ncbi:MAG: NADH-quinone oxidoreductase subunit L [Armatimonadetes bacterium]|nr:NADH-quinone oxidoreductase subunit L [Armatimonadota bacterium]
MAIPVDSQHWANLIWAVLLLPLAGFLFQAAFGKKITDLLGESAGRAVLGFMAVLPIAAGFLLSVIIARNLGGLEPEARLFITTWFNWIDLQSLQVPFELRVDTLSMTMCLIVTGVGALIHLYATGYMAEDRDYPRFFTYMNLFILFMLLLVLGNNLPLMFIGWEGVGLCSYLLIGFWYQKIENAKAANKAFIVNRIGDWGFMIGMFLLFAVFAASQGVIGEGELRYLSFDVMFAHAQEVIPQFGPVVITAIPLLLFVGAMGKSAQFPLYLWLPDAMAGPTPVSALIHAATMVTAGVYMVTRCHIFFELAPVAMLVVACVGAFTAIFAASVAFGQTDIKRVLAYSTVSQLGYMFLACGVGAFSTGMFHVTTHAFFKALLFLGSGSVIMAMSHDQDMRKYGKLSKYLPVTYFTMLVGWLAIAGIPPLAGFFSKDEILSKVFSSGSHWAGQWGGFNPAVLYVVGLVTAVMTAAYMTRMFYLTFHGPEERWRNLPVPAHHHAHAVAVTGEAHGPDEHGFFLADEEVARRAAEEEETHHELGPGHQPREPGFTIRFPLLALAACSLLGGMILAGLNPLAEMFGAETPHFFEVWNEPSAGAALLPAETMFRTEHSTEWILVGVSVLAAVIGIAYMRFRYAKGLPEDERRLRGWRRAAGMQWYFDAAMYRLFVEWGGRFSNGVKRWFDEGVIDGLLVHGSAWTVGAFGKVFRKTETGYVRTYAMTMLLGSVLILGYFIWVVSR